MRIVLAPVGSRGDVQPLLALALGLQGRGHTVAMCVARNFRSFARDHNGLQYYDGGPNVEVLLRERGEALFNPFALFRAGAALVRELFERALAACRAHRADTIIGTPFSVTAPAVADLERLQLFWAGFYPGSLPTREVTFPMLGFSSDSPWLNRASWRLGFGLFTLACKPPLEALRARHGLRPMGNMLRYYEHTGPALHAVSPAVATAPADWKIPVYNTGYWFLNDPSPLSPEIEAFLRAGPPPVYIGFGSMPVSDARRRTAIISAAVKRAGVRAIIGSGWSEIGTGTIGEHCLAIDSVSHQQLFPRLLGVVHHSGAGTSAQAIRAGVPHVPVPHAFDQHYWARRLCALGVATPPLSHRFSIDTLASALGALQARALRERARALAEVVNGEDGIGNAARIIEETCMPPRSSPTL